MIEDAPLLTKPVKINQSEGIPRSGIPERTFVKNSYKRSRTSLPSPPLLFVDFFTSHRSPLSERLEQAIQIYKGLIEPHFDYCSAVWDGLTQQLSEKLQKLQNRAITVITKSSYDTSFRFLLNSLGWDSLSVRRAKHKANLMYKCINNLAPVYLCNLFTPRTLNYYFRNAKEN